MRASPFLARRRPRVLALAASILVATLVNAPAAPVLGARAATADASRAAAQLNAAAVPKLTWASCGEDLADFECTTARVPLDYDLPRGRSITLALTRLPATDRAGRIGTIFIDPGGPGGSGVGFVQRNGKVLFTAEVRAKFDLLGFDPRGIAGSTPLQCFDTTDQALATLTPFWFPYTRKEEQIWARADRAYASACRRRGGPIINHMSTANVVRDMDLLRAAVGDSKMTYVGYSYGSYIGSTYAAMFPRKVRAVVIDGVIDPVSYATGRGNQAKTLPIDARLVSEQGAYKTLQGFLSLCDQGGPNCAFSDGNPKQRYDRLAKRLLAKPAELPDGEGGTFTVTYQDLVITTLGALYSVFDWPDLADFLQALDTASDPALAAASLKALHIRLNMREDPPYQQVLEGFAGVWCADGDNPAKFSAWAKAARAADRRYPYFGRAWNWGSSICAVWPGHDNDAYKGPFNRRTANAVLVVGNVSDPATRYQDAVTTERMLPRARLLTVEGWGHTSLFISSCADGHIARYLLTGKAPPEKTHCGVDAIPFASTTAALRAAAPRVTTTYFLPPAVRPHR
jgi:pimeloyl-ACP methyl ester carboxylesterase